MNITLREFLVRDIFHGFKDEEEEGVVAYDGQLTIRPPYQREFVYKQEQQEAVIYTMLNNYPLNTMYWVKTGDRQYEILDGQQRTLSVMCFLKHKFSVKFMGNIYYADSLTSELYERLLGYKFMVYVCEGTDTEKLEWFRIVNLAGEELTQQELRNSVYTGPWLAAAKKYFSKRSCPAKDISSQYIKGDPNRQELLEKALAGICESKNMKDITEYMAKHKSDTDADELWQYFQDVLSWTKKIFPTYRREMKGLNWCHLYNKFHSNHYNSTTLDADVTRLMKDHEVQKKTGIYEYLLRKDRDPFAFKLLQLREFEDNDQREVYEEQKGVCPVCKQHFEYEQMQGDHKIPWSKGGKTTKENLQMLCKSCNSKKSDKY